MQENSSDTLRATAIHPAVLPAGYTLTNLLGGYLAATVGSKRTLGAGVLVWSAFTMLTPVAAATRGLPLLLATRFSMGAGEGTAYPCIQDVVKGWVPRDARSRALTLIYSGGQLGTILALLTAPIIIDRAGWPAVFVVYGSLGLIWAGAWQFVDETPPIQGEWQQPAAVSTVKNALSSSSSSSISTTTTISSSSSSGRGLAGPTPLPGLLELPWRSFLTNRPFIGVMIAHTAFGVGHYM
jgi:MFS family permease